MPQFEEIKEELISGETNETSNTPRMTQSLKNKMRIKKIIY